MNDVEQKKKLLLSAIIITIVLFIVLLVMYFVFKGIDNNKTKLSYEGVTYKTTEQNIQSEDGQIYSRKTITYNGQEVPLVLTTPDGVAYYSIETIASLLGYKYNRGIYTTTETPDESRDKCYIDNGGEYVNFEADTNKISKYIKVAERNSNSSTGELSQKVSISYGASSGRETEDEEVFSVEYNTIKFPLDEKLYVTEEALTKGFNLILSTQKNIISIYKLDELVEGYGSDLESRGYQLTTNFKNQRALVEGYAIVGKNEKYGVIDTSTYNEIISVKYDTVEYVQSINEFMISSNKKFGMIKPGEEKPTIELKYDNIELMNAENGLYLVELNTKYGVVNSTGKEFIPTEYDQIGLSDASTYSSQGIKSKYIIADEAIPVVKNGKYGLYSLDRKSRVSDTIYTTIGCEDPSKILNDTTVLPTVTVPLTDEISAIVFSITNAAGQQLYGLLSSDGIVLQNAYYEAIYHKLDDGQLKYYLIEPNSNRAIELERYIKSHQAIQNYIK